MNFSKAKTSEKLEFLADMIETKHAEIFYQGYHEDCAVGIGARINGSGSLRKHDFLESGSELFGRKYGVTEEETDALFLARYSGLRTRLKDRDFVEVTPQVAACAVRSLARKYARRDK
jgi:hypothetical protein